MSNKSLDILKWNDASQHFDMGDFHGSLSLLRDIADTSKIHFNIGRVFERQGLLEEAIAAYENSLSMDSYLAVCYFALGNCLFTKGRYTDAVREYEDAFLYMRGNLSIDYEQLGMKFKLFTAQILFNKAVCFIRLKEIDAGEKDISEAENLAQGNEELLTLVKSFSKQSKIITLPDSAIFRPSTSKVEAVQKINYIGKSKIIASIDPNDNIIGFKAPQLLKKQNRSGEKENNLGSNKKIFSKSEVELSSNTKVRQSRTRDEGKDPIFSGGAREISPTTDGYSRRAERSNEDKLRIKCHLKDETRIIFISINGLNIETLKKRVQAKWSDKLDPEVTADSIRLKYMDEEGDFILLNDDEDFAMAFDKNSSRTNNNTFTAAGGGLKLDLWVIMTREEIIAPNK